jgi:hypothetical protein
LTPTRRAVNQADERDAQVDRGEIANEHLDKRLTFRKPPTEGTKYEASHTENRTATINPTPKIGFRRFPKSRRQKANANLTQ